MRLIALLPLLILAFALPVFPQPAAAQDNLFAPRVIVNGRAITNYEHRQRMIFMTLLRAPGDLDEEAEKALVEDRLRLEAAKQLGVEITDEQVRAGMEEFASRANLSGDEFLRAIGQAGVAPETFRDFVEAGLVWRDVVRARFGQRVDISEAEIDRALALSSQRGVGTRVLMSEIVIPAPEGDTQAQALANRLARSIRSEAAFAEAARTYSAAGSREQGGRLEWMPLANLPPAIRPVVLGLAPGQVTQPVRIPNAIALFQLRAIREAGETAAEGVTLEYAQFLIPGANAEAEAAQLRTRIDVCTDLYGVARDLPEERLTVENRPVSEIPVEIAQELAALDEGESSIRLTRGNARVFLMLCKRQAGGEEALPARGEVRNRLINERLNSYSESYMADLVADAIIRYP